MAHLTILSEGWTLRDKDGALEIMIPEIPETVQKTLARAGWISQNPSGLQMLKDEWIYAREWTYEVRFFPETGDERCVLLTEGLRGLRAAYLNGEKAELSGVQSEMDLTNLLLPEENVLSLIFGAERNEPMGLCAPVKLRFESYMTLMGKTLTAGDGKISAALDLRVHTAGNYLIRMAAALDGEPAGQTEFTEALRPGFREIAAEMPVENPAAYDPARPEETLYSVKLTVEKQGAGCETVIGNCAFTDQKPLRVLSLPVGTGREGRETELARELNADGVLWNGDSLAAGFLPVTEKTALSRLCALSDGTTMGKIAGGEGFWPPKKGGMWALTASPLPDGAALEKLYGANALGDMNRAIRLSRFLQAENLRREAVEARWAGKPFGVRLIEERPVLSSDAIIEYSGKKRPAWYALRQAWAQTALYADLPEDRRVLPGQGFGVGLRVLSKGQNRVCALEAQCLNIRGKTEAAVTLPVLLGGNLCAGSLMCPGLTEGVYLLRMTLKSGDEVLCMADFLFAVTDAQHPMEPLMNPPTALLTFRDGMIRNEGDTAALCVCAGDYRTLLPGEQTPGNEAECLNSAV